MRAVAELQGKHGPLEVPALDRDSARLRPGLDLPKSAASERAPGSLGGNGNGSGHSFAQLAVHAPQVGGSVSKHSGACPLLPSACPYGGACHTCPAAAAPGGG